MEDPKKQLRLHFQNKRRAIDASLRREWSRKICQHLEGWLLQRKPSGVFAFRSFADEVCVNDWLDQLSHRYPVALPIARSGGRMDFHHYVAGQDLLPNRWGIEEPRPEEPIMPVRAGAVILVPALAISASGHRLGYGGGFYDRFLAQYPLLIKVGVVFAQFAGQELPKEEHDIPVDFVVHENGIDTINKRAMTL